MKTPILVLALLLIGCNRGDEIPVIGIDENGNAAEVRIPSATYSKRLSALLRAADSEVLPAIGRNPPAGPWALRTIVVGLGVSADVGVGPIKIGAVPRTSVVFSNSTDPTLP